MEQAFSRLRCAAAAKEIVMKTLMALGLASVITATAVVPVQAREGCGRGFHRARNGMCRPNRDNRQVFVVGRYYSGRGYWWQNRWYQHRHRRNGVWIYL
jgi:hypothetical protein